MGSSSCALCIFANGFKCFYDWYWYSMHSQYAVGLSLFDQESFSTDFCVMRRTVINNHPISIEFASGATDESNKRANIKCYAVAQRSVSPSLSLRNVHVWSLPPIISNENTCGTDAISSFTFRLFNQTHQIGCCYFQRHCSSEYP